MEPQPTTLWGIVILVIGYIVRWLQATYLSPVKPPAPVDPANPAPAPTPAPTPVPAPLAPPAPLLPNLLSGLILPFLLKMLGIGAGGGGGVKMFGAEPLAAEDKAAIAALAHTIKSDSSVRQEFLALLNEPATPMRQPANQ